ncbi:MAG: carboxyl transferase domain-containing protein [Egicoccus sp.]
MSTITRIDLPRSLRRGDLRPLPATAHTPARGGDPLGFPGYADKLAGLADHDESVAVGLATLAGQDVVVALGDFSFLGGSMGQVHGDRVAAAMEVALEQRLPFLAVTASGGARMQEGMVSLVQMARTAEGIRRLRDAGLPVLAHFTHPTTGGVHASYGALADVVVADAGATIGFAGPRVVEAFTGEAVGGDSHTAEAALRAGLVDVVAAEGDAPPYLEAYVDLLHPALRHGPLPAADHVEEPVVVHGAWDAVRAARRTDRPSARDLLRDVFDDHLELRGDRAGEDDPAVVAAVARLGQRRVVVVGFDRRGVADVPGRRPGQATAAGFRKLRRAADLARRWNLPLVSFVDTPGADPSPASDRAGLAAAIAETFVAVLAVEAPTVAVVTGEGGSGGALAIGATDRLLMQDDAVFEVIAPEGAASILHRDPTRAEDVAPLLKPTASALRELGICDRVVPGPTTFDPATAVTALRAELAATLADLDADDDRLDARHRRYGA